MGLLEGGAFQCYLHHFETSDISKWNEHCTSTEDHTESGSTICIICGEQIEFTDLPFHPLAADGSKGIALKCEDCEAKTIGKVKRMKTTK